MKKETIERIKKNEGLRLKPYLCPAGKLTIGYGRNLEDVGISKEEAENLLKNDLKRVEDECKNNFPFYLNLNESRRGVILEMCFNMGISRLSCFKKMIKAIEKKDYKTASCEMLDSKWATQVKKRAIELSKIMDSGKEE